MNYKLLIFRNLWYYRKAYLAVLGGAAISIAVLTGAMSVGDSVRFSLEKLTVTRLGKTRIVLQSADYLFSDSLAASISRETGEKTASLLVTEGIAVNSGNGKRINRAAITGINDHFSRFWEIPPVIPGEDEAVISRNTASKLGLKTGDEFMARIRKEGNTPGNAPFAAEKSSYEAVRLKVRAILEDDQGGRFSMKSNQSAPFNIFISLRQMNRILGLRGKSNLLLIPGNRDEKPDINRFDSLLGKIWKTEDAGLKVRKTNRPGQFEIISERIFMDDAVSDAIRSTIPGAAGVDTWLANSIRSKAGSTPYSFVSAADSTFFGNGSPSQRGIIINQWLAEDLHVTKGDSLTLRYFIMGPSFTLSEDSARFRVISVIPMQSPLCDAALMPVFPGMSDAGSCRDWETATPVDMKKIRDKDEKYWKIYRGTPKAFISLETGKELWKNRFGSYTAFRFPANEMQLQEYLPLIMRKLKPSGNGLLFIPAYEEGKASAADSTDFGQLFLGLSFLIILSATLLMGMIFTVHIRSRIREAGILSATGFRKSIIIRILLAESAVVAVLAGIPGTLAGIGYNRLMLLGLNTLWQGSVHTSSLEMHLRFATLASGAGAGIGIAFLVLLIVLYRSLKDPLVILLKGSGGNLMLKRKKTRETSPHFPGFMALVMRNAGQNRKRMAGAVILLAIGTFTIIVTGANRRAFPGNGHERGSGTGGFLFWAESTIPVREDLNSDEGKKQFLKGDDSLFRNTRFLQMYMKDGNDASCLNLNRVNNPSLLGIDADYFDRVSAFSFREFSAGVITEHPWRNLKKPLSADVIPGFADLTVIKWGLGKSVGDTIGYVAESGKPLGIKLVGGLDNSIFQGNILISDSLFRIFFPSAAGSRVMLVDGPSTEMARTGNELEHIFTDYGMVVTPATQRLAEFNSVQNTYLSVFMMLGGFGVIIGTFGLGFLLIRNLMDRRQELAICLAAGFTKRFMIRLLVTEHLLVLVSGIILGIAASLPLLIPVLKTPGSLFPFGFTVMILGTVFITGFLWIIFPLRAVMKQDLVTVLMEGK